MGKKLKKILNFVMNIHNVEVTFIDDDCIQISQGDNLSTLRKDIILSKCKGFLHNNYIDFAIIYSNPIKTVHARDYESNMCFTGTDSSEFEAIIELTYFNIEKFKTSKDWANELKVSVLDPDGWDRKNYKFSFNEELISEYEFNKRLLHSTITRY